MAACEPKSSTYVQARRTSQECVRLACSQLADARTTSTLPRGLRPLHPLHPQVWRTAHPPLRGTQLLGRRPLVHKGFLASWLFKGYNTQARMAAMQSMLCMAWIAGQHSGRQRRVPRAATAVQSKRSRQSASSGRHGMALTASASNPRYACNRRAQPAPLLGPCRCCSESVRFWRGTTSTAPSPLATSPATGAAWLMRRRMRAPQLLRRQSSEQRGAAATPAASAQAAAAAPAGGEGDPFVYLSQGTALVRSASVQLGLVKT